MKTSESCLLSELKMSRLNTGPFVGRHRVDEDVTVDVDGVALRENGVLVLQQTRSSSQTWGCESSSPQRVVSPGLNWSHLARRVHQLQVVLLTVHRHRLAESWQQTQQGWKVSGSGPGPGTRRGRTYCSRWSDRRSPQTDPPQTGWWGRTSLNNTNTHTERTREQVRHKQSLTHKDPSLCCTLTRLWRPAGSWFHRTVLFNVSGMKSLDLEEPDEPGHTEPAGHWDI